MNNQVVDKKNILFIIGSAIFLGIIAFLLWMLFNPNTNTHSDIAYVPNIDMLTDSSTIVIKGTVLDEVEEANLQRNPEDPSKESRSITPGKYHSVVIDEVLAGSIDEKDKIKIAVTGGSYKGVKSEVQADLKNGHSYVFFLNTSSRGQPYYFGAGEPYIFEIEDNKIKAVSNLKYEEIFEDNNISEQALLDKINRSLKD